LVITKGISVAKIIQWTGHHILWLMIFMGGIAALYYFKIITIALPWLPISVIGTAVAFYVGFKNNQSYDRMWEARKIWGGIVNDSRTWGMMVDGYISNLFAKNENTEQEIYNIKKRLIYRHVAWLYAHRSQLLVSTPWEHASQRGSVGRVAKYYQKNFGVGLVDDEVTRTELKLFLPPDEHDRLINYVNTATQIINEQSRDLRELRSLGLIDDFRHMEMGNVLKSFYTLQGKNERIKKFPLPRQYANMSRYFVGIFIILFPFSMIPELMGLSHHGAWIAVPIAALVGWIYIIMLSLCRVIEIDLREMLKETELPPSVKAKNGVLM